MISELAERDLIQCCNTKKVGVVRTDGQYYLVAFTTIGAGDTIFKIKGQYTKRPSRYSVQVGQKLHIDVVPGMSSEDILDNFFWRFMNHSCEPNVIIRECDVIAIRRISLWEEIRFNYNTVEYDMAEPFECCCDTPSCLGTIKGYKYLSDEERHRLRPHTAQHLLELNLSTPYN